MHNTRIAINLNENQLSTDQVIKFMEWGFEVQRDEQRETSWLLSPYSTPYHARQLIYALEEDGIKALINFEVEPGHGLIFQPDLVMPEMIDREASALVMHIAESVGGEADNFFLYMTREDRFRGRKFAIDFFNEHNEEDAMHITCDSYNLKKMWEQMARGSYRHFHAQVVKTPSQLN